MLGYHLRQSISKYTNDIKSIDGMVTFIPLLYPLAMAASASGAKGAKGDQNVAPNMKTIPPTAEQKDALIIFMGENLDVARNQLVFLLEVPFHCHIIMLFS